MSAPEAGRTTLLVETSALVAILFEEPEWETFAQQILAQRSLTTVANVFEAVLALTKIATDRPTTAHGRVVKLIERLGIALAPLTPEMLPYAVAARERYGRGRKGLNMGDCLSYGAAKALGLKLLYKGEDFERTDVNG